jgi:dienelactone hydrolase
MRKISFKSRVQTGNDNIDTVQTIHLPIPGSKCAAIVLHGYTMRKEGLLDYGALLNSQGISTFHPDLPYHGERGVNGDGYMPAEIDPEKIKNALNQMVADVGDLITLAKELGNQRVGLMGYSLGAISTMLMLGKDSRIAKGLAICGGGDLADIILRSPISADLARRFKDSGIDYEKFREVLREVEPCNYARNIQKGRLMMLNGKHDHIVFPENTKKFIDCLREKQEIFWIDCDHFPSSGEVNPAVERFGESIKNG